MRFEFCFLYAFLGPIVGSADGPLEPLGNADHLAVELKRLPERLRGPQGDLALVEVLRLLDEHGSELVPIDEGYRVPVRRVLIPLLAELTPELRRRYERLMAGPAARALPHATEADYRRLARSRPAVPAALAGLRSAAVCAARRGAFGEAAACLEELRDHARGAGRDSPDFVSRLLEAVLENRSPNRESPAAPEPPWPVVRVRVAPGLAEPIPCGNHLYAVRRERLCRWSNEEDRWLELPLPPGVLGLRRCERLVGTQEFLVDAQTAEGRQIIVLNPARGEAFRHYAVPADTRLVAMSGTPNRIIALFVGPDRAAILSAWGRDGGSRWSVPILRLPTSSGERLPIRLILAGEDVVLVEYGGLCVASAGSDGSPLWARQFPQSPRGLRASAEFVVFLTEDRLRCCSVISGEEQWQMPFPARGGLLGIDRRRVFLTTDERVRGLRAAALPDGSTHRPQGWFLHTDGGLRTSGTGDVSDSLLAWPTTDGLFVLDTVDGEQVRLPIRVRAAWVRLAERTLFWAEQSPSN